MFPFENSGEISFQATNNEQEQVDLILQNDLLASINLSNPSTTTTARTTTTTTTKGRGRASGRGHGQKSWPADTRDGAGVISGSGGLGIIIEENDMKKKKMVHRDIERQRRQGMSSLFSTLHSLLPLQYVKGKRSTSDHIAESINYIKDLQNNIKELGAKRDELKLFKDYKSGGSLGRHGERSSTRSTTGCNVTVYTSSVGLHVQIVTGQSGERFALSTALKVLHEEGLNVVSCVSNRANKAFFHNIICQVNDTKCFDVDIERLQQRLYGAVC